MKNVIDDWLLLRPLARLDDYALLIMRLGTAVFIAEGVWDNVTDADRMAEFVGFMAANGFWQPDFWAPFSVYTQLLAAILLAVGLLTRWAGLILMITFVIGLVMVHLNQPLREQWPALALVLIGLLLATRGGGRFAFDRFLESS